MAKETRVEVDWLTRACPGRARRRVRHEQGMAKAYREINEFERMLIDSGMRLVKLFLHITADEQVRRFRDRLIDPFKRWKLSYEDFRNHARWSDCEMAIGDMMGETSTKHAPWHLIPANNKPYSRIAAFRILVDRLGNIAGGAGG
jgi:AMP-polyphosphate phosphotransferase